MYNLIHLNHAYEGWRSSTSPINPSMRSIKSVKKQIWWERRQAYCNKGELRAPSFCKRWGRINFATELYCLRNQKLVLYSKVDHKKKIVLGCGEYRMANICILSPLSFRNRFKKCPSTLGGGVCPTLLIRRPGNLCKSCFWNRENPFI